MKIGFYYSLLDWRFPGYWEPKKYPDSAEAMIRQYHEQVRELLTNYGKIDVLWYDGDWVPDLAQEERAAFWRSAEVNKMARKLQPHILINNRSGLEEDLDTPEQHVTASEPGRGWESCMTMGDSWGWGYIRHSQNFKTVTQLVQNLAYAAAGEGNYLLNIGPKPDGSVRKEERDRLAALGKWLRVHGEAVYGTQRAPLEAGMLGLWTRKGDVGYLHVFDWPGSEVVVPAIKTRVKSATLLTTKQRAKVRQEYNGRLVLSGLPDTPPDPHVSVIKVQFAEEPRPLDEPDKSAWLTGDAQ